MAELEQRVLVLASELDVLVARELVLVGPLHHQGVGALGEASELHALHVGAQLVVWVALGRPGRVVAAIVDVVVGHVAVPEVVLTRAHLVERLLAEPLGDVQPVHDREGALA